MSDYNYAKFSTGDYELERFVGPGLGDKAPDFEVSTVDGETRRLLDFPGVFLVLEMGSITCPLFQGRRKTMADLVALFPTVSHGILYVREAHPGAKIGKHEGMADKIGCARQLRDGYGEQRQVLIDDMAGTAHAAYGSRPNSVFIINRNGCVVFYSDWNNPRATTRALGKLMAGKAAGDVKSYFKPVVPPVLVRTLGRGGKGSAADFLAGFPKLFWVNLIKRNLRLLFRRDVGVLPDITC